ncbi:hypothetical protein T492DRAFT_479619 [Pavlovales sp. CCMP2436]|nr:hypothetical protein T492DRAFT_479619 [Pavlovales sp. CCMP2436]
MFCVLNSKDVLHVQSMQRSQFTTMIKDSGLVDELSLTGNGIDLLFQRANMDFRGDLRAKEKDAGSDGGVESMVESEFVNGLVRVAHLRFGGANGSSPSFVSLQERLEHLLSVHLIPTARYAPSCSHYHHD